MHIIGTNDGRMVYARPRVPSKVQGRIGTRRAWKRANPPGVYMHMRCYDAEGNLRDEYLC